MSDFTVATEGRVISLTQVVDARRLDINSRLDPEAKSAQGQFMTPRPVAQFMASLFERRSGHVHLLDAGAGIGSLTAAFVEEFCNRSSIDHITATAYELEPIMVEGLRTTLDECKATCRQAGVEFDPEVIQQDFIRSGLYSLFGEDGPLFKDAAPPQKFTHAILNPPYKKIHSDSAHRRNLRALGIETSNLYAGFLAVAIKLLESEGELVTITPRSFCNGPYFKPFRQLLLDGMNIKRIHVFESRMQAFRDDEILQENVIFHAVKGRQQGEVTLSTSEGIDFRHLHTRTVDFSQVVSPGDPDRFIHIVADEADQRLAERMYALPCTLEELGIDASTGPVVDFRLKNYLRRDPEPGTVPLIYPAHCRGNFVVWPAMEGKKPNAILATEPVKRWLYPNGHYLVVRRFSAKEERRRVVAAIYHPQAAPGEKIGFENHLNVLHRNRQGLTPQLVRGLALYLNSTFYDRCFRQFNGHTQVNVHDLYNLRYPDLAMLEKLGSRIYGWVFPAQEELDRWMEDALF